MSSGKRYKFNGSTFGVQTALGTQKTISAITSANPPVVSSAGHGFATGGVIKLFDVAGGFAVLDNSLQVVDNSASGTYELAGVDASAYAAFAAGGGDSPPVAYAKPVTFGDFCELTGANQQDGGANQHEVSTICSDAKEFEQGLSDSGTLQLDFNWAGNETVQAALRAAKLSGDKLAFKITFPNSGGVVIMIGTVQQTSFQGSVSSGVWTASATIKLSGPIFVLEAA